MRAAFAWIGIGGLLLAVAYAALVRESRLGANDNRDREKITLKRLKALFAGRSLNCSYVASGLQLFTAAAIPAWLPTYFVRYYDLPLGKAASLAAIFLGIGGAGMIGCGMLSDRLVRDTNQRALLAAGFCVGSAMLVGAAFTVEPGVPQLLLLGTAMFLAASTAGPAGAMVANLTPKALHGTAFAVLTLANNAFGLAPGPIVTGWLADRIGLLGALQWLPVASLAAAVAFLAAARGAQPELASPRTA